MSIKTKTSVSYWKAKCWDLFSKIIRTRDCKETLNRFDWGKCCTCGIIKEFKDLQAGHFIPGRHNSVLFDMRNCHAQCYRCNVPLKGNLVEYYDFMLKKYGQSTIDELRKLDKDTMQFKAYQLKDFYEQLQVIKRALEYEQNN